MNWQNLPGLFVTGTDTGVGKTYVCALILKELRELGFKALPFKPVCSGSLEDCDRLFEASDGVLAREIITPYFYQSPLAPLAASELEGFVLNLDDIQKKAEALSAQCDLLLVEGVGGWEVPLAPDVSTADLVRKLGFPVLLVVENRLGALNHTLLTLKAIERDGLECIGIILNHIEQERNLATVTNRNMLEKLTKIPVLAEMITDADYIDWEDGR